MKRFFFLVMASSLAGIVYAQEKITPVPKEPAGKNNFAGANAQWLFGEFGETHSAGFGLYYVRAKDRLGKLKKLPAKKIGFCFEGGASYYLGKNEDVGASDVYHYPDFSFIHIYGGGIWNPMKTLHARLTAGPALAFYDGTTRFNLGINLEVNYYPGECWGFGPGLRLMKEGGSAALATASLQVHFSF